MKKFHLAILSILAIATFQNKALSQTEVNPGQLIGQTKELNPITTSVPFLMIAPDSRAAGMGDAGAATSPDINSQHWNSSKYVFAEKPMGISLTYTPWLKNIVNDMNIIYLSGYFQFDNKQAFGASLKYFSMGEIHFRRDASDPGQTGKPNEWALDASYNRKLSDNFSLGIVGRFILSDLTNRYSNSTSEKTQAGKSVAMDINGFYSSEEFRLGDYDATWAAGFNFSNLGSKLGYSEESKNFIPSNMRLGGALNIELDRYNKVMIAGDINKLLVPTPAQYAQDTNGTPYIVKGKDSRDIGLFSGVFQSFNDAPGGMKEEMQEIAYSVGAEYWYANQFAARVGYFFENINKGNRKYLTFGASLKMNVFGIDFAYLFPTGQTGTSPLANTWRFSLLWDIQPE